MSHPIDQAKILSTIRDHLPFAGESRVVGNGIEWHSGPGDNKTLVSVSPSEQGVLVRVDARQHGLKGMAYLGATLAGAACSAIGVALWSAPGAAVGAAGLVASLAGARAIWNRYARRRDQRLRTLTDALVEQLDDSNRSDV